MTENGKQIVQKNDPESHQLLIHSFHVALPFVTNSFSYWTLALVVLAYIRIQTITYLGLPNLNAQAKTDSKCAVEDRGDQVLQVDQGDASLDQGCQLGHSDDALEEAQTDLAEAPSRLEKALFLRTQEGLGATAKAKCQPKSKPGPKAKAKGKPGPKAKAKGKPGPKAKAKGKPGPKGKPKAEAIVKSVAAKQLELVVLKKPAVAGNKVKANAKVKVQNKSMNKKAPKKALSMTTQCVYSRAYHQTRSTLTAFFL